MEDLMKLRESIDEIDSEIVRLYKERMDISKHVAEYKITTGKKVFDKTREDEKLEKLSSLADDEFLKHGIVELFEQIMSTSRKKQYQLMTEHGIVEKENFTEVDSLDFSNARIVFQGVEGAYSQLAMKTYFGENCNGYNVDSWKDAMEDIKKMTKKSELTEDDQKNLEKELQDITDKHCKEIDTLTAEKEKELMEI